MRRRILSIQGGGVNGLFAAKFLAEIEKDLDARGQYARSGRYFDLISGTSTGGLIALGLALEVPAAKIVDLYQEKSRVIFPGRRRNWAWKASRRPFRWPIYQPGPLIEELKSVFGERKLVEATSRVIIPTYNQSADCVHLFKTAHHENFVRDFKIEAWDIAAATAAAPFYFPPHKMADGASFLDGGVWANNPTLIAIAECIEYCGWDRSELDILSIGGVRDINSISSWQKLTGLPGSLIHAQVKGNIATAKTLLGDVRGAIAPAGTLQDLSSNIPTGAFALDDARSVDDLIGKSNTLYRSVGLGVLNSFFTELAEDFQSIYAL